MIDKKYVCAYQDVSRKFLNIWGQFYSVSSDATAH